MKQRILLLLATILFYKADAQRLDSLPITGGYLYYHVYGSGKPVVILTGGPGISCEQQEDVAKKISSKYMAILIEQRGTGKSIPKTLDKEHINIDTAAGDIKKVLTHLKLKEAAIYGHSYGSLLALYFGVKYPGNTTRLVLVGPAPFKYAEQMPVYADNKEARFGLSDLQQLNELDAKATKGELTAADSANFRKINNSTILFDKMKTDSIMLFISKGKMNSTTMALMPRSYAHLDLTSQLKQFNKPIDIICGRQDALAFMAYEYKLVKQDITLRWISQSGHFPMFEQENTFYSSLLQALK